MVISTAVSPIESCATAFMIRDICLLLHSYYQKKIKIDGVLEASKETVRRRKQEFDDSWVDRYSSTPKFWTFEKIICRYKESLKFLRSMGKASLKPHITALSKNQLLFKMIKVAEDICADTYEKPLQEFKILEVEDFYNRMNDLRIGKQENMLKLEKAGPNFEKELCQIESETRKIYLDIISKLPKPLSMKILLKLSAPDVSRISTVCKSWLGIARHPILWKCLSHLNGWGISFVYPKNMDWMRFYQNLNMLKKSKIPSAIEVFKYEMAGVSGLK